MPSQARWSGPASLYFERALPDRCLMTLLRWSSVVVVAACSGACGGSEVREPGDGMSPPPFDGTSAPLDGTAAPSGVGADERQAPPDESALSGPDFGVSDARTTSVEVVCAAQSAASELRHVSMSFLFDVSASMGGNDANRFNTKWLPVVAATEAFFTEPDAAALSASLTFFPREEGGASCTPDAYLQPDVAETPLPSPLFGSAISGLGYALGSNNWRFSTPTLAAYSGVVAALAGAPDDTLRAIVMVTDGVPLGCNNGANDIQRVADAVRASGITTFVIGVANPPGDNAGDNLQNLDVVAEAGGTERAFIIATGDPAQTEADFKAVIDGIRGVTLACNMAIPLPPAGNAFVPEQVNVIYGGAGSPDTRLVYDPDCTTPDGWRYDDPSDPAAIVLCSASCDRAQRDASARLSVEFGCERQGLPR